MKHNSDVPGQLALFAIPTVETRTTVYDPYWDEIETAPKQTHSVGGQILEAESPCKSVGEQVTNNTLNTCLHSKRVNFDTKKSAPQHDTHWVERYWVERSSNKYWYFRYCWMTGRKINRLYLGSVNSIRARRKKADVEVWIADGKLPVEIKQLIQDWKHEPSTMPKVSGNARFQER
jgi:hypothetical protein